MPAHDRVKRPVAGSVSELLAGAELREPMDKAAESLSGSPFERVVIGGQPYVLKHLALDLDWIMRVTDDTDCRALTLWRTGLLDQVPGSIDHTIVGMAHDPATGRTAVLMRDVGERFVAVGDGRIPLDQHLRFLNDMTAVHAAFWGFVDSFGLCEHRGRYTALGPAKAAAEVAAGTMPARNPTTPPKDTVPHLIGPGWSALAGAAPEAHDHALALSADPAPLGVALDATPQTLVHGDWKAGNLGTHPDGRTILVDWAWTGQAGGCVDLAWYLAVNCDLLPQSKEAAIEDYRLALERRAIDTRGWFERQLELALLGAFVQLGWSKAAQPAELAWWVDRVVPTARSLRRGGS